MLCMLMMKQEATLRSEQKTIKEGFLNKKYRRTKSYTYQSSCMTGANKFEGFIKKETRFDSLEELQKAIFEKQIENPISLLDDHLTYLRNYTTKKGKGLSNGAIRTYMILAKELVRFMGCKIYDEDFRQMITLPPKEESEEELLTKEIINRLLRNSPQKLQTVILLLCSSGMRIGELVQLKLSDIDFATNPAIISLRKSTVKGKIQPRKTHLSTEATKALKDYLTKEFSWSENNNQKDRHIFLKSHEARLEHYKKILEDDKLYPLYRSGIIKDKIPKLQNRC